MTSDEIAFLKKKLEEFWETCNPDRVCTKKFYHTKNIVTGLLLQRAAELIAAAERSAAWDELAKRSGGEPIPDQMAESIEEICRQILQKACEDGLVKFNRAAFRNTDSPLELTSGDLAGVANLLAKLLTTEEGK